MRAKDEGRPGCTRNPPLPRGILVHGFRFLLHLSRDIAFVEKILETIDVDEYGVGEEKSVS